MSDTVVLTNGAWHGAWAWASVAPRLAAAGLTPVTAELEGFGGLRGADPRSRRASAFDPHAFATEVSPVATVTLDSAVATLLADIEALGRGPVTVVAHSLGGTVVAAAAQRAPELFAGLVLVSALTPVAGLPASAYNVAPEMADSQLPGLIAADPAVVGAVRIDVDSVDGRERVREALFADVEPGLAERALSMLTCDAPVGVDAAVDATPQAFGSLPKTWILCGRDHAVTPALQRRLIREIDAVSTRATEVVELDCSHSPFLSHPAELAEAVVAAARSAGRA